MYAYIKGEIVDLSEDNVVIECNNIGYNIHVPASMIARLPGVGSTVKIYTYTSVKEDSFNCGITQEESIWCMIFRCFPQTISLISFLFSSKKR